MENKEYKVEIDHDLLVTNMDYKGQRLNLVTKRDEQKPHIFNHTLYHNKSATIFKPQYYTELPKERTEYITKEHLEQIIQNHNKTYNILLKSLPKIKFLN